MKETVLCYIEKNNQYLLMYRNKKKYDYNANKWIGIGGKIEPLEEKEDALLREVKEETGLDLISYSYRGTVRFINDDFEELMHVYTSRLFSGQLLDSCDEGELHWVNKSEIMRLEIWEGDRIFLHMLINNEPFFKLTLYYKNDAFVDYKLEKI